MGSLRKLEGFALFRNPIDEPVQLLSADEGYVRVTFPGLRYLDANQSERRASFLMPGEPVPQSQYEDSQQLIDRVEAVELELICVI